MTDDQLFNQIKILLDVLADYKKTSKFSITQEQRQSLTDIYKQINPQVNLTANCDNCAINAIGLLMPYYEREYQKYISEQHLNARKDPGVFICC